MEPRFFSCSVPECEKPSVRGIGGCDDCKRYLCSAHLSPAVHLCPKVLDDATYVSRITTEIDHLRAKINDVAVCQLASALNSGKSCTIEHSSKVGPDALMGSANYHARLRFDDGSPSWLLRVPRVTSLAVGFPASLAEYLVRSEYATLKFLETTRVPAPRAFSHGLCSDGSDRGVGVSFLLLEELPGKPWTGDGTADDKARIWRGLAEIMVELERHPFSMAGSLCFQSGSEIDVSATASDRFVVLSPSGPFASSTAYYTAFAEQYLALIADDQLYTEYPVNAYLVYRFLKENVSQLAEQDTEIHSAEQFFLKHVDDKGDHLLIDESFNIAGIIDWQMARVLPRREAFGPSLVTADMKALCNGKVSLSDDDLALAPALRHEGISSLSESMLDEKARRFFWGLALEPKWSYALPLANAILQVFGAGQAWTQWRGTALKKYETDERLRGLVRRFGR